MLLSGIVPLNAVCKVVEWVVTRQGPGDVVVFMPTWSSMVTAERKLRWGVGDRTS